MYGKVIFRSQITKVTSQNQHTKTVTVVKVQSPNEKRYNSHWLNFTFRICYC